MTNILATKAMLAAPSIAIWTARRLDKRVTDEVNESHNAKADVARVNKLLVPKAAIAPIEKIANEARSYHYARTLPWIHKGADLLSAMAFPDYAAKMKEYRREFESAVAVFVADYPNHVASAPQRMNGLFNPADYPSADAIRTRFRFRLDIMPVPDASDFRVDIGTEQAESIRADIESRMNDAIGLAMRDVWQRIAERVSKMAERLRDYKPGGYEYTWRNPKTGEEKNVTKAANDFHDSLVENVRELVAILPSLNIIGDKKLASIAERMERELCAEDSKALKANPQARESVAESAESILADVSAFLA